MSGFVAMLQLDGSPVDRKILQNLTGALRFRGPDAEQVWVSETIGLGHTMFRTTFEAEHEVQPCNLDDKTWIAGDIRIDGRTELIQKLEAHGRTGVAKSTDPELVLHAYACWGDECVKHLLGDFSFAIWDGARQRLFCARDHFGVRGFYYAQVGRTLVLSNSLRCVRAHPEVSDRFNDLAICDFLMFGYNQENATTTFADIQRLLPGHTLTWSKYEAGGEIGIRRYWSLPVDEPLRYKRSGEYVEHFRELLRDAVNDRLRTNKVGVYMSGGLDSSLLAATTKRILASQTGDYDLRAYTCVYDRLIPDEERHYAGMVARHLQIPIHFQVLDGYQPYERWGEEGLHPPEPLNEPYSVQNIDSYRELTTHSRVAFYGEGPDNLLVYERRSYISYLLGQGRYWRAGVDFVQSFLARPSIPSGILREAQRPNDNTLPAWIRPDVVARYGLKERWERLCSSVPESPHPLRPKAYRSMSQPPWQRLFERLDSDWAGVAIDVRQPFLDLRVVKFFLAIPAIPWCRDKLLLRKALQGCIPEEVRQRRKSPLAGDVFPASIKGRNFAERNPLHQEVFRYITATPDLNSINDADIWLATAPLSLSLWLSHVGLGPQSTLTVNNRRR